MWVGNTKATLRLEPRGMNDARDTTIPLARVLFMRPELSSGAPEDACEAREAESTSV